MHDLLQVIHRVKKHVIQVANLALDIARHREVDHEDRPAAARLERALDEPLAQDRQRRRRARHDDVVLVQVLGQLAQLDRTRVEAARQRMTTLQGAVRHGHPRRALRGEMRRAQFDHLAGADQQHVLVVQRREDARGELDRRGGHRHAVRADLRIGAHVFRHREGALEQLVQDRSERAGRFGNADRFLQLPEDLRLAQHHRIEARGDAERMPHRLLAGQRVEIRRKLVGPKTVIFREPCRGRLRFARGHIHLGAVAGRQDGRFGRAAPAHQLTQRALERVRSERDPLTNVERRGLVVQSEGEQGHRAQALVSSRFYALRAGKGGSAASAMPVGLRPTRREQSARRAVHLLCKTLRHL